MILTAAITHQLYVEKYAKQHKGLNMSPGQHAKCVHDPGISCDNTVIMIHSYYTRMQRRCIDDTQTQATCSLN